MEEGMEIHNTVKEREIWIDSLKGIACVCVLNGHFLGTYKNEYGEISSFFQFLVEFPLNPLFNGGLMVCIFAVLSGLLIAKSRNQRFNLAKKLVRRYIQLDIPIIVTGAVVYIFGNLHAGRLKIIPLQTVLFECVCVGYYCLGNPPLIQHFG